MIKQNFTAAENKQIQSLITLALQEDIGSGDITSQLLVPEEASATMELRAREVLVVSGLELLPMVFSELSDGISIHTSAQCGDAASAGATLATLIGPARALLTGERVALNLIQRLCGIATLTRHYVDAIKGTNATLLDTRKTMPGFRALDKYAVRCGGAQNHRTGLYDMVMIKDNHIALAGSLTEAYRRAQSANVPVMVECDTLAQVQEALVIGVKRILLDNMSLQELREAVALNQGRAKLEASGGVNLTTVRAIAETGVDYISVGALTHSAVAADIGADIVITL